MKKILFLTTGLIKSGAENQLFLLATGLKERGYSVTIASLIGGNLVAPLRERGIRVVCQDELAMRMSPFRIITYITFIRSLMVHSSPDVVHSFLSHTNIFLKLALVGLPRSFKIGISFRTPPLRLPLIAALDYIFMWNVDFITTNSHKSAEEVKLLYGIFSIPITIIPNGFLPSHVPRSESDTSQEFPYKKIVTTVAQYRKEKDYMTNIKVAEYVVSKVPDAHFLYIGEGRERISIESRIRVSKAKDNIHLLGRRSDVENVLNVSNVFFLPTLGESQSNALIEAMHARLPIVTTDIKANRETAPHARFVPLKDVYRMGQALVEVLNTGDDDRAKMNFTFFKKTYDCERMIESYRALYESLAK